MLRVTRPEAGFSLTELMVTVAIAATLAGIGIPSYREYVRRANRADATTALLSLASAQERFYLANNTYASAAQLEEAPPDGLGMPSTERGYYTLDIDSDDLTLGYVATATIADGEAQTDDENCVSFSVNERSLRTAENADGDDNTEDCWR
ncbi:MAG: prepilin-type N-terminal cleavage/methylation domain-containing protein [Gammaproteobacteria bacterium]|nr:prepilin-type N-terminal cleavage/methylation domain-containing protein [Gammaproteobacteria bacterium]